MMKERIRKNGTQSRVTSGSNNESHVRRGQYLK